MEKEKDPLTSRQERIRGPQLISLKERCIQRESRRNERSKVKKGMKIIIIGRVTTRKFQKHQEKKFQRKKFQRTKFQKKKVPGEKIPAKKKNSREKKIHRKSSRETKISEKKF